MLCSVDHLLFYIYDWTYPLIEDLIVIWNLGHWDLFGIWILVLGIYLFNQAGFYPVAS